MLSIEFMINNKKAGQHNKVQIIGLWLSRVKIPLRVTL